MEMGLLCSELSAVWGTGHAVSVPIAGDLGMETLGCL